MEPLGWHIGIVVVAAAAAAAQQLLLLPWLVVCGGFDQLVELRG
jgi:hypothetical protein